MDTDLVVDFSIAKAEEFAALLALPSQHRPGDLCYRSGLHGVVFIEARLFGNEAVEFAVATAEDTILRKLLWYRAGGEVSERQWNDTRGIVRLNRSTLDMDYLRKWAVHLKVDDLLEALWGE